MRKRCGPLYPPPRSLKKAGGKTWIPRKQVIVAIVVLGNMFGVSYLIIQMMEYVFTSNNEFSSSSLSSSSSYSYSISSSPTESLPLPRINTTQVNFLSPQAFAANRYPQHRWGSRHTAESSSIIDPQDSILTPGKGWDSSPIVLEDFRLLFFTTPKVGTTVFKQLFRRMMGVPLWPLGDINIPHNPQSNGLKYLYDFSFERVDEILTSPNWTRAIFVRDPLERVLSAYLDKAVRQNGTYVKRHCCGIKDDDGMSYTQREQQQQQEKIRQQLEQREQQYTTRRGSHLLFTNSMTTTTTHQRRLQVMNMRVMNRLRSDSALLAMMTTNRVAQPQSVPVGAPLPASCNNLTTSSPITWNIFVHDLLASCSEDSHWKSQVIPSLKWINFVGHFDSIQSDTQRLLERVGAWEQYGARDWPEGGAIFQGNTAQHKTSSRELLGRYYADHEVRQKVLHLYQQDYENPILNLTRPKF